ncbi:MAG TPA: hypothetical protein VLG67_01955 [Candidatus Saccharimonadales bacterium]|nr:hypothetical protein [Candidatus Saccharimonadales bacterium]
MTRPEGGPTRRERIRAKVRRITDRLVPPREDLPEPALLEPFNEVLVEEFVKARILRMDRFMRRKTEPGKYIVLFADGESDSKRDSAEIVRRLYAHLGKEVPPDPTAAELQVQLLASQDPSSGLPKAATYTDGTLHAEIVALTPVPPYHEIQKRTTYTWGADTLDAKPGITIHMLGRTQ